MSLTTKQSDARLEEKDLRWWLRGLFRRGKVISRNLAKKPDLCSRELRVIVELNARRHLMISEADGFLIVTVNPMFLELIHATYPDTTMREGIEKTVSWAIETARRQKPKSRKRKS